MNVKDIITSSSGLLIEGMKLTGQWLKNSKFRFHTKEYKRMKKAIEAGERYILTNEDDNLKKRLRVKYLKKYKNNFFDNNN